jgi:hypothetical protein
VVLMLLGAPGCATQGRTYLTPSDAMAAVAAVVGTGNREGFEEILGPRATDVLESGDPVADRADGQLVRRMILEHVEFAEDGDTAVAIIGQESWPFPIPLVKVKGGWRFDLDAGEQELLNRRVGHNELLIMATLHEYVDAQREYAAVGRDGHPSAFAQSFRSRPGRHDGLYWEAAGGEAESPLGPLVAQAMAEGYSASDEGPRPFHGYYFRILTEQGPHAPGGATSYVNPAGLMTGGFAAVAWPASWGNSGVKTFVVNQVGVVFEKDLGRDTASAVASITAFDPDKTWGPAHD